MKHSTVALLKQPLEFLQWWADELRAATHDLRTYLVPHWRKSLTIYVSSARIQIFEGDSITDTPSVEITDSAEDSQAALSEEQRAVLSSGQRCRLVLDPELAFIQRLRLPLAAVPHLASAIELQMSKLLPVQAEQLKTDFEIHEVDASSGWVNVDLAAIKRSDIERVEKRMEPWGLRTASIHLWSKSEPHIRFRFGSSDDRRGRFALTRSDTFLGLTAATLAASLVLVFAVQTFRAQKSLQRALEQTTTEATTVLEQRQSLASDLETLSLISKLERAPTAAAILAEVTSHLGRDSWLTTFDLKGRDLRLVGLSPEPATAVKDLAQSTLITAIQLHSSSSAGTNSDKDRFEITAQVKESP